MAFYLFLGVREMHKISLYWATFTIAAIATTKLLWMVKPSIAAEASFPITEMHWRNWNKYQPWQTMSFVVPDQDTTVSSSGGELRRYDIHIAKMFEVTHYLCQNKQKPKLFDFLNRTATLVDMFNTLNSPLKVKRIDEGSIWYYDAANGNTLMGEFKISCKQAQDIVSAYGLDWSEPTKVKRWVDRIRVRGQQFLIDEYEIPTLKISETKTQKWMDFVQTFKPSEFSDYYKKIEVEKQTLQFPFEKVIPEIRKITDVPILLPSELPWMPIGEIASRIGVEADPNGYTVCLSRQSCRRPPSRHFDFIMANRSEELNPPDWVGPRDTFREIELSGGIQGFFHEACGVYCISTVRWKYRGVVYTVIARFGEQPILVKIANSMIEAGER
jgi:hypothetical protein